MKVIELKNINKKFDTDYIFKDFNLDIYEGDFIILEGKSGAGKSTLLNIIASFEPIDSGSIKINSKSIKKQTIFRNDITCIFQNFFLENGKSVKYNLSLAQKFNKYSNKEEKTMEIQNVLKKVDLENFEEKKVYTLSGGQQQRVALARAIIKGNNIILADEPTGSLDDENEIIVMDILKDLNSEGKTIIMVSHNKDIFKYANKIIKIGSKA